MEKKRVKVMRRERSREVSERVRDRRQTQKRGWGGGVVVEGEDAG